MTTAEYREYRYPDVDQQVVEHRAVALACWLHGLSRYATATLSYLVSTDFWPRDWREDLTYPAEELFNAGLITADYKPDWGALARAALTAHELRQIGGTT